MVSAALLAAVVAAVVAAAEVPTLDAKTTLDLVDAMSVANGDEGVAKALVAWKKCAESGAAIFGCDQALAIARHTHITAPGPAGDTKGSLGQPLGMGAGPLSGTGGTGGAGGDNGLWSSSVLRRSWAIQAAKLAKTKRVTATAAKAQRAAELSVRQATAVSEAGKAALVTQQAEATAKDKVLTRIAEDEGKGCRYSPEPSPVARVHP